jgi:hypothetical protein
LKKTKGTTMPGFLTDYTNNAILNLIFGAATYTPTATLYLGLSQSSSNKGAILTEPTGGGYARVAIANTLDNFSVASAGTKSNTEAIKFPIPTGDWGTMLSLFIADSPTGGNVLAMADLTRPKTIKSGGTAATVAVGALFLSHT